MANKTVAQLKQELIDYMAINNLSINDAIDDTVKNGHYTLSHYRPSLVEKQYKSMIDTYIQQVLIRSLKDIQNESNAARIAYLENHYWMDNHRAFSISNDTLYNDSLGAGQQNIWTRIHKFGGNPMSLHLNFPAKKESKLWICGDLSGRTIADMRQNIISAWNTILASILATKDASNHSSFVTIVEKFTDSHGFDAVGDCMRVFCKKLDSAIERRESQETK